MESKRSLFMPIWSKPWNRAWNRVARSFSTNVRQASQRRLRVPMFDQLHVQIEDQIKEDLKDGK